MLTAHPTIGDAGGTDALGLSDAPIVPLSLMSHPLLATLANDMLGAFNDLRECAPLAIAGTVATAVNDGLAQVATALVGFHGDHAHHFDQREQQVFEKMCIMFAETLVPSMAKCNRAIYPDQLFSSKGLSAGANLHPSMVIDAEAVSKSLAALCASHTACELRAPFRPRLHTHPRRPPARKRSVALY